MDKKDGKKKESIDEILSDLNGLLNKMPSILDGIKMPEIKPVEFSKPAPAPEAEPVKNDVPPKQDAEKTIILEALSGLPEGAELPKEKAAETPQDAGDKTMVIETFSSLPTGASIPDADKLVPQSLGDFMFGEGAQDQAPAQAAPAEVPAVQPEAVQPAEAPPSDEKAEIVFPEFVPQPAEAESDLSPAAIELPDLEPETPAQPAPAAQNAYESTRDFGIPDIDALMQLSEGEMQGLTGQEPAAKAEPAPEAAPAEKEELAAPEPEKSEPSMDELAEFEAQLKAAAPKGEAMEKKPEEEKQDVQPAEEAVQLPAAEPAPAPAAEPAGIEAFIIEPQPAAAEPETPALEVQAQPVPQAEETLQLERPGAVNAAPAEPAPASGGIELSIGQPESTQQFGVPQASAKAEETLPGGLAFEPASAAVSGGPSGDETLVVPPPAAASGEEDKTVIFEVGAGPGITSRSQAGDLAGLAERPVPEGIPAERVRTIAFLYATEDKALCATVLAELDAICLKSASKPMFVKRSSVRECAPDMNANYILQTVTDAGAQGLVCVGSVPQEKLYEIESAFSTSGGFFRHYDSAGFSHSSALDLVTDLILR
jgi:hypothetical protein